MIATSCEILNLEMTLPVNFHIMFSRERFGFSNFKAFRTWVSFLVNVVFFCNMHFQSSSLITRVVTYLKYDWYLKVMKDKST